MPAALTCILLCLCLVAEAAPDSKVKVLLDSADALCYDQYENTMSILDQAEKLTVDERPDKRLELLIQILQIRITTNRYFQHFALYRKYLLERQELIVQSRQELRDNYERYSLENSLSWAEYYYIIGDYSQSQTLFSAGLKVLRKDSLTRDNCLTIFSVTQYLAALQLSSGQFNAAINQYLSSIPYYECALNKSDTPNYLLIYRNIAQAYLAKKDFANSKVYLDKAVVSLESYKRQKKSSASTYAQRFIVLYEQIALYYREINKPDSSLISFQKVIPFLPQNEPSRGRVYLGLGEAYAAVGNVVQASAYLQKAERVYIETLGAKSTDLSKTHLNMGNLAQRQGNYDQAFNYYQMAMSDNILDYDGRSGSNPRLRNILSKKWLFNVLDKKSELFWNEYRKRNDRRFLDQAWESNQLSLALLDSASNELGLDADKVILAEQSFGAFEKGVRLAYELYILTRQDHYMEDCFTMVDKSKGVVLLENLRFVNRYAGVDTAMMDHEKAIRTELFQIEEDILAEETKEQSSQKLYALRERYATAKGEYSAWTEKIKKEAPSYYQLKFDHHALNSQEIRQQLLQPGEVLIEFFMADSTLTVFGLSKNGTYFFQQPLPSDFVSQIDQFRQSISTLAKSNQTNRLKEVTPALYHLLLKGCLDAVGKDATHLIIIPDGMLGYVPFEVLSPSIDSPNLVTRYSVRYAYSASYLKEQLQKKKSPASRYFAGFVSSGDSSSTSLSFLKAARGEIKGISQFYSRGFSVFDPATKKDFTQHAKDYKVLHLAMHAEVNDMNPMLSHMIFAENQADSIDSESYLTAIELYNMELNAEMAVLSACNTGFGQIHRGEGILSLSRAFAYAGVPSAVISLWAVPDKATSKVMLSYYHHLNEGLPKDQALQQAKLDFITANPEMSHPFFWAGFIVTGSNEPIEFPGVLVWPWAVGVCLVVGLGVLFVVRRAGKRKM